MTHPKTCVRSWGASGASAPAVAIAAMILLGVPWAVGVVTLTVWVLA